MPFAIVARLCFRTRIIFIETITKIHSPLLTGRIMYLLADRFFYQWEGLGRFFPRGEYGGPLL